MFQPELIFFDVGGTLLEPHPHVGAIYAEVAEEFGCSLDAEETHAAFAAAFHEAKRRHLKERGFFFGFDVPSERAMWRDIVDETFDALGTELNRDTLFERLWREMARPERYALLDGVPETLLALRERGLPLGLISNWDHRLRTVLEGMNLTPLFDPIVISCEVGAEKPDSRIFQVALSAAGVNAESCLMVGDHPFADLEGARQVGMRAVLLDRSGQWRDEPDRIRSVSELLAWLDQ
jgi:putative hydrolase of the HAD superfamily